MFSSLTSNFRTARGSAAAVALATFLSGCASMQPNQPPQIHVTYNAGNMCEFDREIVFVEKGQNLRSRSEVDAFIRECGQIKYAEYAAKICEQEIAQDDFSMFCQVTLLMIANGNPDVRSAVLSVIEENKLKSKSADLMRCPYTETTDEQGFRNHTVDLMGCRYELPAGQ